MRRGRPYLWFFTLLVTILVPLAPVAGATKPDADFIARAMEQQELSCGASLEVRYTVTHPAVGSVAETTKDVHYIRTRNALFASVDRAGDCAACITQRYDRVSRAVRRLSVGTSKNGLVSTSGVNTGIDVCECQDPVVYPLAIGPLYQAIKQGVVADEQELVDGHLCWRIDIAETITGYKSTHSWSIWVDPEIGLCPRRLKSTFTSGIEKEAKPRVTFQHFLDYRSLGNGAYFPMEQRASLDGVLPKDGSEPQIRVKDVKCGRHVPEEELAVKFPSGTNVYVSPLDASYVEP